MAASPARKRSSSSSPRGSTDLHHPVTGLFHRKSYAQWLVRKDPRNDGAALLSAESGSGRRVRPHRRYPLSPSPGRCPFWAYLGCPEIARKLVISTGNNKGKNPPVATVYRVLAGDAPEG